MVPTTEGDDTELKTKCDFKVRVLDKCINKSVTVLVIQCGWETLSINKSFQAAGYAMKDAAKNMKLGRFEPIFLQAWGETVWRYGIVIPSGLVRIKNGEVVNAYGPAQGKINRLQKRLQQKTEQLALDYDINVYPDGEYVVGKTIIFEKENSFWFCDFKWNNDTRFFIQSLLRIVVGDRILSWCLKDFLEVVNARIQEKNETREKSKEKHRGVIRIAEEEICKAELMEQLWLLDLGRSVSNHFVSERVEEVIDWDSPVQVGPYIVKFLRRTWQIVKSIDVPNTVITEFVARGLKDSLLPYTPRQVYFLNAVDKQAFLTAQQELLAVCFRPGEHKVLQDHEMVPFIDIEGAFGTVSRVIEGGTELCRKQIDEEEEAMKERKILARLPEAAHLLRLRASYTKGGSTFLVLEPGVHLDLDMLIEKPTKFSFWANALPADHPEMVISWMVCLSAALATLHSHKVEHIDIQPHNIGLRVDTGNRATPFILDYGHSGCGSPFYSSPEKIKMKKEGGTGDVFSLGLVFMDLLCLLDEDVRREWSKFVGRKTTPAASLIMKKRTWHQQVFGNAHALILEISSVVLKMLEVEPTSRISYEEAYKCLVTPGWTKVHCKPVLKASQSNEGQDANEDVTKGSVNRGKKALDAFLSNYMKRGK